MVSSLGFNFTHAAWDPHTHRGRVFKRNYFIETCSGSEAGSYETLNPKPHTPYQVIRAGELGVYMGDFVRLQKQSDEDVSTPPLHFF